MKQMKRLLLFSVSFVFCFLVLQISAGVMVTFLYEPDITEAWNASDGLSQSLVLQGSSVLLTIIFVLVSAVISYFIQRKVIKHSL
ncbi:hypothetical protein [Virgibacillus pantothenticus]|nr:hypothetical protein [Virgibacillus pantothenticus]MEB5467200.1 hypothetical protein [Virgibacillus pantothenticus]